MGRIYGDKLSKPQPKGRDGQLGVGSTGKGVRERLEPERSLGFELPEKEVRCGEEGRGRLCTWMKPCCMQVPGPGSQSGHLDAGQHL